MVQNETQEEAHLEIEMKLLQSLAEIRPFSSSPHTKGENNLQGNSVCAELSVGSSCNTVTCTCRCPQRVKTRLGECTGTNKYRDANTHRPVFVSHMHTFV